MNQKLLPIGQDDFRMLRESEKESYYVDKTLLIKDFLDYSNPVTLITRPRRFGKTLNMTMIRDFFDITADSGTIFLGLAIMDSEYADRMNSKPVISLSLKGCTGNTVQDLVTAVAEEIFLEYKKYGEHLVSVDPEDASYMRFFQTLNILKSIEGKHKSRNEHIQSNISFLTRSLFYLTEALHTFYGVRPIVLIDEYDAPIIEAHGRGFRTDFTDFYASFLTHALKGNPHLGQALLTGIQRIAKESIFSKLNHLAVCTVLDSEYAPYFGLTEAETTKILEDYGYLLTSEIKHYYDGYSFGSIEIYNPWSILTFLRKGILAPYWLNTSTNGLIRELVPHGDEDFSKEFEVLIKEGQVEVYMNLEASFFEIEEAETLWGLLVNSGYLTVVEEVGEEEYLLRIPNQEVKKEFRTLVAKYANIRESIVHRIFSALSDSDMSKFIENYKKLIVSVVSYYDAPASEENKLSENSFHMLFLGMAISTSGMYEIKSNREMGDGRSDIMMKSLEPSVRPHILVEFKQDKNLQKGASDALNQIFENRYYAELTGNVLCMGIAHAGKKCEVVHEEIVVN